MKIVFGLYVIGLIARVEQVARSRRELIIAHLIEDIDKLLIVLAEDMVELDIHGRYLLKHTRLEEIWPLIILPEDIPLLLPSYWRELKKVANKKHLHSAKRRIAVAVMTENGINGIEQIGSHHGNLVNHEQLQIAKHLNFLLAHLHLLKQRASCFLRREKELGRNLKKRMDSRSTRVDGCYSGRCHYGHLLE